MNDPTRVFDRVMIFASAMGVLVMAAIFVLVLQGPASGGQVDEEGGAGTAPAVVEIELSEFAISGDLTAPAGPVTLQVTNVGSVPHDLALEDGPSTPQLTGGETATLELGDMEEGSYRILCTVAGHEAARAEAKRIDPDREDWTE